MTVTGDQLLAATGRAPRTDEIGLDTVGLRPGSWLNVDDTCRVEGGGDWLYAAGDVNHRALAHPHGQVPGQSVWRCDRGASQGGPPRGTAGVVEVRRDR